MQGATDSCEEGPFFTTDSADVPSGGDLAAPGTVGEKLVFEGTIKNLQGEPVKGATAEVWQADGDGLYDIQYPDRAGPNDRGRVHARADGTLSFRGVLPTAYPIPADGPIGEFLRALGRHPHRAAHLHFRLAAPGYDELTTALYPAHSPFLGSDPVWATKRSLITDVEPVTDAARIAAFGFGADTPRVFLWKYDFVLATEAEVAALKQKTLHPTVLAGQTKAQ
jgi:protocatechuate 3,4-dioxygenase beta subunit